MTPLTVIALKNFEKDYLKAEKAHQERIICLTKRIREQGMSALKILKPHGQYVVAEAKSKNPPYRLYVIVDKIANTAYLVSWSHKDKQRNEISKLEGLFEKGFKAGLDYFLKSKSTNPSLG